MRHWLWPALCLCLLGGAHLALSVTTRRVDAGVADDTVLPLEYELLLGVGRTLGSYKQNVFQTLFQ